MLMGFAFIMLSGDGRQVAPCALAHLWRWSAVRTATITGRQWPHAHMHVCHKSTLESSVMGAGLLHAFALTAAQLADRCIRSM
jgi:hypothetical protein